MSNKPNNLNLAVAGANGQTVPFLINPVPCVQTASEDINIRMNLDAIQRWISVCAPNDEKVIICSAGPSLEKYIPRIKEYVEKGYKVSCVKHSLPVLVKAGITPDYCVVLDPRCVIGHSTHGEKRIDLYRQAPDSTVFFIASVTDFRTVDFLLRNNKKVVGWHRFVDALKAYPNLQPQLGGGSCSALGSIGLFFALGFREMILVGFDSSYNEEPKKTKLKTFQFGSKYEPQTKFIATGELGAQAQEIEDLISKNMQLIKFDVWSEGLGGTIWKYAQRNCSLPDFKLVLL